MTEQTLSVALGPGVVEAIAERAAELVLERMGPVASAPSPYLTIAEAAEHARCDRQRIYDLRSSGRLSRLGDGARGLVSREELDAYLAGRCPPVAPGGAGGLVESARGARQE